MRVWIREAALAGIQVNRIADNIMYVSLPACAVCVNSSLDTFAALYLKRDSDEEKVLVGITVRDFVCLDIYYIVRDEAERMRAV